MSRERLMVTGEGQKGLDEKIREAARIIRHGGVCVIPTETGYGLAASIKRPEALKKIFDIKNRSIDKPLLVLVETLESAPVVIPKISDAAWILMEHYWPGPLTLLLPAREGLPVFLTGNTGKIGVRISSHPVAMALVKIVGHPITATSANLSGHKLPKDIKMVARELSESPPDIYLNAGSISPGPASTIIDVTSEPPILIREGAINLEDILVECGIELSGCSL